MKIDQPYIPIVKQAPKPQGTPHSTAVPVVQGRPQRREEQPKKKQSSPNKKNPSRNPLFSSLVARELSSRLASEVHEHEGEEQNLSLEEMMNEDITEEEFLALQAEAQSREAAALADLESSTPKESK